MLDELQGRLPRARGPVPELAHATGPVIRESADRALGRRRRPGRGARLRRERPPAALAPEDRAAGRLELLDQGPAAARVPRARAGSRRRRPARPRPAAAAAPRSTTRRRRHVGQPIVTTCYSSSRAGRHRGGRRARLGLHLPRVARTGAAERSGRPTTARSCRSWRPCARAPTSRSPSASASRRASDIEALGAVGADAAIVGSACVACVADALGRRARRRRGLPARCSSSWARLPS